MKVLTSLRLLAVPAAALLALPGCRKNAEARMDPEWWKLEAERVDLAHQVEVLEIRLSKITRGVEGYADLDAELDRDVERRALLMERAGFLKAEVAALSEQAGRERSEWIRQARESAVGKSFASFSGARGRTYEDVKITRVTDIGIEFRHSTGSARLSAAELTPAQQGSFGVDAGLAGEAMMQEKAVAAAYESWVDVSVASSTAAKEEADRAAQVALVAAAAAVPRRQSAVTPEVASTSRTRLRDEPRSYGRSYSRSYSVYYPSYNRTRYYYPNVYCSPSYYSPCPVQPAYNPRSVTRSWGYVAPGYGGCRSTPVVPIRPTTSITFP